MLLKFFPFSQYFLIHLYEQCLLSCRLIAQAFYCCYQHCCSFAYTSHNSYHVAYKKCTEAISVMEKGFIVWDPQTAWGAFMSAQSSELLPINVYYLRLTFLLIKTNRFVSEKTRFLCKMLLDTEWTEHWLKAIYSTALQWQSGRVRTVATSKKRYGIYKKNHN